MARIPRRIARINVLEHGLTVEGEEIEPVEVVEEPAPVTAKKKTTKKEPKKPSKSEK
tara:strand:- start:588 stop:758 length:171 start_codon:yes stop_codon:yes gene_type:complete